MRLHYTGNIKYISEYNDKKKGNMPLIKFLFNQKEKVLCINQANLKNSLKNRPILMEFTNKIMCVI